MFAPVKMRKGIPRTTFGLTLAIRKVFQKILLNFPCPLSRKLRLLFGIQRGAVNFLHSYVYWSDGETKFFGKSRVYGIDLIDAHIYKIH